MRQNELILFVCLFVFYSILRCVFLLLCPSSHISTLLYCSFGLIELAVQLDEGKDLAKTVEAIKDANKRGALHFAAREGQTEICNYLLRDLKLNVDSKDDDGDY